MRTERVNLPSEGSEFYDAVAGGPIGHGSRLYISQQARKKLGLHRGRKERRLPQLLADADLKATCTPRRAIDNYSRPGGSGRSRHAESSKLFKATGRWPVSHCT
jgi:hypothetical protein